MGEGPIAREGTHPTRHRVFGEVGQIPVMEVICQADGTGHTWRAAEEKIAAPGMSQRGAGKSAQIVVVRKDLLEGDRKGVRLDSEPDHDEVLRPREGPRLPPLGD